MIKIGYQFIENELHQQNPWWDDPAILAIDSGVSKRAMFSTLLSYVKDGSLMTSIVGLRRIGKTTIVKQLINTLFDDVDDRRRLLYFSFEEFTLGKDPDLLAHIIDTQRKRFPTGRIFFFFDEIQYVREWNAVLKKYGDLDMRYVFVVTGSSSLFLKTRARESLAGRMREVQMYPLGFGEYLQIYHDVALPVSDWRSSKTYSEDVWRILRDTFPEYLCWGEFPFLQKLTSWEERREYVLSWVIGKVLEFDLPGLVRIIKPEELIRLGHVCIEGSSQLVELQNLALDLGISRLTIATYLSYLERANLIRTIFNQGSGFRTRSTRQRKIYASSVNALSLKTTLGPHSDGFGLQSGKIVETFVANYLTHLYGQDVYFWRQRQAKEVDFLITAQNQKIPVEVKYQAVIRAGDLSHLLYFAQKNRLKDAYVITKERSGAEEIDGVAVHFVPAMTLL